jgi:small-conductance mechanosensitive channel
MLYEFTGTGWIDAAISCAIAALLALLVHAVALFFLRRIFAHRPLASRFLKAASTPARWVLVLAAMSAVLDDAPPDLPLRAIVVHAITLGMIAALTALATRLIGGLADAVFELHPAAGDDSVHSRALRTQTRVIGRSLKGIAIVVGIAAALVTFPGVRQLGATLLASAGVAGLVAGLAARPVLANLMAGLQIALTQPIRIGDAVIVENEFGRIEEIGGSFVIVKIWDERRMLLPLKWFIENPFQNWTRSSTQMLGTVYLWLDYGVPVEDLRAQVAAIVRETPLWDGRVAGLVVTDANERAVQLRALVSAADSGKLFDLRCFVRERLIRYVQEKYPQHLPRTRLELPAPDAEPASASSAA